MQPKDSAFQPIPGMQTPRFAGMPTFMRLPHLDLESAQAAKADIGIVGVPFDGGTSNRPGPRHGPRQLRDLSTMIRTTHPRSGVNPFKLVNCADLGDAPVNPMDIMQSLDMITGFFNRMSDKGIVPLTAGGDHLISFPILRALGRDGPVGMIHFDAHTDMNDVYFGDSKYTHGTPFRRAIEQGFLDPKRTIQIGIRGVKYEVSDFDWALEQGVRIVEIDEFFERGVASVMTEAREIVGDGKTYISFDIDGIDPAFAPGTGTPEIGGFTTYQAQQMVRALEGLNLVGADLVEVSPPFDPSGGTAWVGVSIMFELLCVLATAQDARSHSQV
ncbi:agmatinase [Pararhodobacter sp.]|uniref:agmatinase n=1 Tax=Pararhodobacter sp. TaxID=2127056 RepID=UPI002FDDF43F